MLNRILFALRRLLAQPMYKHDCKHCVYLGPYKDSEGDWYDLYYCLQLDKFPTVIARWDSYGPYYNSGLGSQLETLKAAQLRAKAKGLLP